MRRILLTLAKIFAVIAAAFLLCGSARGLKAPGSTVI